MYCAATETGYEELSGKSSDVFTPTVTKRDKDGTPVEIEPAKAGLGDYLKLAIAGVIAAYEADGKEMPLNPKDIMYKASSQEIQELVLTINQLRMDWYQVPNTVKTEQEKDETGDDQKND